MMNGNTYSVDWSQYQNLSTELYKPTFGAGNKYSTDWNYQQYLKGIPRPSIWFVDRNKDGKHDFNVTPTQNYLLAKSTNIQLGNVAQQLTGLAIGSLASFGGIPQVAQIGQSIVDSSNNYSIRSTYAVADPRNNFSIPGVAYPDFRARKGYKNPLEIRLDGASAATRGSIKAAIYAAANASYVGPYSIFNLDGQGKSGFGWGDHGNPYALKNDFTAQSHVATKWDITKKEWAPVTNPLSVATAFRGDKVNVIDFGKRNLKEAYLWRPKRQVLGADLDKLGLTQDFIKFYFTGPKLQAGNEIDTDDIIIFRAIMNNLSDTFSPSWTAQQLIGRADPNYHYTQFTRDLQLDFSVYATDRDELKPIWRKLNALAGYTAPEYVADSIALRAPWMRITIGDLFVQQPVIITSLGFTLHDSDTTWEINIENDPTMMQVPHKISVSMGLTPIMDQLPQKGGRFYTLAKEFDKQAQPKLGNNNWLSDANPNPIVKLSADELAAINTITTALNRT